MSTDMSEAGLESLIVNQMRAGEAGWVAGNPQHYNREYCVDLVQLREFLAVTQPEVVEALDLANDSPTRRRFLARLEGEVSKRGVIDVLRRGVKHEKHDIDLFYGAPTEGNDSARLLNDANRFVVTRQLAYSNDETRRALDLALFINGLPIATFELKNNYTKQTVEDAIEQYKRDRSPREKLFGFGRCMVHFAVDDQEVWMCTKLDGKASWFLPFNQGWNHGAGNPPNPDGIKTDYLWRRTLSPASLTDIIENYAQILEEKDDKTGKKKRVQIFPRFHQLKAVRRLLEDAATNGAGKRYLIQHSAGSGKSKSITWLAHQLVSLQKDQQPVFDSIIVMTDRRNLDKQLSKEIKQFAQVGSTVGHADKSSTLRHHIEDGKKIIISTIQKFPYVLDEIGGLGGRTFAIIIDEAHSSQGGKNARAVGQALGDELDQEDLVNKAIEERKLITNASYFAFTATPKNKTQQIFGESFQDGGKEKFKPFDNYTMKQAIEEGFILDVLKNYTPVQSYYKLIKTIEVDPEFDKKRAHKKLRKYVESNDHAIRVKAEIMVDHFHEQVVAHHKMGGEARAMVVCNGIERAVQYFHAIKSYLGERKSPYQALVAFSGEHEYNDKKETESSLNGFRSSEIEDKLKQDPYRFLIVADKFQTGYDEPLLHTMYVDKTLSGIKAVQTLSRLNRAHPKKHDVFVLDFINEADDIQRAFADYYRTTVLSEATDPNKLHDLKASLDDADVYTDGQIDTFVIRYLQGADRDELDPILDQCVTVYQDELDEDAQVEFKSKAKSFTRTYEFLAKILPYNNASWEKLATFLDFLVSKLPTPKEEDFSKGVLQSIDMDSYRVEKQSTMSVVLADEDAEIGPVPTSGGGGKAEPEFDRLSAILQNFNDQFGDINWTDEDRIRRLITEEIPDKVSADVAYQNARKNNDEQNARIEHDKALGRAMNDFMKDDTELYKQYSDNESFRKMLSDAVFDATYKKSA